MKELSTDTKPASIELKTEIQVKKQVKLLSTLHPQRGHSCFKLNLATGKVDLAVFTETSLNSITGSIRKKIVTEEGCIYVTALNKKNAIKRFRKTLSQFGLKAD